MGLDRAVLFRLATSERLERAVKRAPGGEAAAWRAASRYVAGRSRSDALEAVARLLEQGHGASIDLFGERVRDRDEADRVLEDYLALAAALPAAPADVWLSVDLSHLALDTDVPAAAERLAAIARALPVGRRVQVGAEEAARTDAILRCVLDVAGQGLADRLGATLQANLMRSPADADALAAAGVHVRLVKGAYVEAAGAHPHGEPTEVAFLRLGFGLAERGVAWSIATHDARLREALLLAHGPLTVEQLFGVRPEALCELRARGIPTRVYVPYGAEWFRYWLRRVAESRGV
jgi:proline dehydrogenase